MVPGVLNFLYRAVGISTTILFHPRLTDQWVQDAEADNSIHWLIPSGGTQKKVAKLVFAAKLAVYLTPCGNQVLTEMPRGIWIENYELVCYSADRHRFIRDFQSHRQEHPGKAL